MNWFSDCLQIHRRRKIITAAEPTFAAQHCCWLAACSFSASRDQVSLRFYSILVKLDCFTKVQCQTLVITCTTLVPNGLHQSSSLTVLCDSDRTFDRPGSFVIAVRVEHIACAAGKFLIFFFYSTLMLNVNVGSSVDYWLGRLVHCLTSLFKKKNVVVSVVVVVSLTNQFTLNFFFWCYDWLSWKKIQLTPKSGAYFFSKKKIKVKFF